MPFRRTRGILSDTTSAVIDADVIMTAAVLGFTVVQIVDEKHPVRFDMEDHSEWPTPAEIKAWEEDWEKFKNVIHKISKAVHLNVSAGHSPLTPDKSKGAVIMGVYELANHHSPPSFTEPELSPKGKILFDQIKEEQMPLYVGRGAYTGFVDNHNTEGDTDPVGPYSTVRFLCKHQDDEVITQRWLPAKDSPVWENRERLGHENDYVSWGIIGGDRAHRPVSKNYHGEMTNLSDEITETMKSDGMVFEGSPDKEDIVGYTHGMIQAICKAYGLGPNCDPYEITVGEKTTKLASCFPCTLFMTATGYPPSSIHLGRGESWLPLSEAYKPKHAESEGAVVRDLNNRWSEACDKYLRRGLDVLAHKDVINATHKASLKALTMFLDKPTGEQNKVASTLILDAITVHESEISRLNRTLK